jgi:tRNA(adenine34) deaminase
MTPEEMMRFALDTAERGLDAGEQPIGAVVFHGDEVVGRAYTQEKTLRRRIVHADLLAMIAADEALGFGERPHPLRLAVTLEPCVMCLGTAMALGVDEVVYALGSPDDGGAWIARQWRPEGTVAWFKPPAIVAGVGADRSRELFRRYCRQAPPSPMRDWALTLVEG